MNDSQFVLEDRPCSECKQYVLPVTGWPYCRKKLMGVTRDMRVYYKAEDGTCFEEGGEMDA